MVDDKSTEQEFGLRNIVLNDDNADKLFFYGSPNDFRSFIKIADKSVGIIQSASSVRMIVLETWLLLDYSVRALLLTILNLNQLNHPDYELSEFLLPRSFSDCVDLIYKIKDVNMKLPDNQDFYSIKLKGKFLFYLENNEPEIFTQFLRIEEEYYQKYYPELSKTYRESLLGKGLFPITLSTKEFKRISIDILSFIDRLDQEWIRKAKKLYSARNLAAHSHDEIKIAERMGYIGNNLLVHTRAECLLTIEILLGIKQRNVG